MLLVGWGATLGVITGVSIFVGQPHLIEYVQAESTIEVENIQPEPKEVRIEVVYNWTAERIEQEIRAVFHEMPNTAVATFKCESGLKPVIQSNHILSYGREQSFGPLQIHAPDHEVTAKKLGLADYRTNPKSNIQLGRYIYDQRIKHGGYPFQDWTCYNQGLYKKHL